MKIFLEIVKIMSIRLKHKTSKWSMYIRLKCQMHFYHHHSCNERYLSLHSRLIHDPLHSFHFPPVGCKCFFNAEHRMYLIMYQFQRENISTTPYYNVLGVRHATRGFLIWVMRACPSSIARLPHLVLRTKCVLYE